MAAEQAEAYWTFEPVAGGAPVDTQAAYAQLKQQIKAVEPILEPVVVCLDSSATSHATCFVVGLAAVG